MALPSPAPLAPAAPGPPLPPVKTQRARISEKKRKKARELEQELLFLQARARFEEEPELIELLQTAITAAHRLGECSRQSDRDLVLSVLERYDAAEIEDFKDETGLSRWVLDEILGEFEQRGLISKQPVPDPVDAVGGRPRHVYTLTHSMS